MARQSRDPLPYGVLRGSGGATYGFDAGALSLQFVATGGEAERRVFETLHTPGDLARWLAASPLGTPEDLHLTRDDLAAAKRLREAVWEIATRRARGALPLPAVYVSTVNACAAAPPLVPVLSPGGADRPRWAGPVRADQVLSSLARDAIDLFTGPGAARIRQCEGDACRLVFVDTSRPGRRRWCSMQRCGNLHKQRTLRRRARQASE